MSFPSLPQDFNHLMVALFLFIIYFTYSNVKSDVNSTSALQEQLFNSLDLFESTEDSITSTIEIQNLDSQLTKIESFMNGTSLRKKINIDSLKKALDSISQASHNASSKK